MKMRRRMFWCDTSSQVFSGGNGLVVAQQRSQVQEILDCNPLQQQELYIKDWGLRWCRRDLRRDFRRDLSTRWCLIHSLSKGKKVWINTHNESDLSVSLKLVSNEKKVTFSFSVWRMGSDVFDVCSTHSQLLLLLLSDPVLSSKRRLDQHRVTHASSYNASYNQLLVSRRVTCIRQ